jgi:hypothetical protein
MSFLNINGGLIAARDIGHEIYIGDRSRAQASMMQVRGMAHARKGRT